MLLLLVSLLSGAVFADSHDLYCESYDCVIPYSDDGVQNGTETCYGDTEHKVKVKEVLWKNGKREGVARCWKKDGKPSDEMTYKNDRPNGPYIDRDYDSNGSRYYFLENGEEKGLSFSMKDGKVTYLAYCVVNGKPDPQATLQCEDYDYGTYAAAVKAKIDEELTKNKANAAKHAKTMNGPQESKYSSGKLRAKWTNKDGDMQGQYLGYYENGKVQADCMYANDKKDGKCELFDEQGRLDERGLWEKGVLTKKEEFFDNGKMSRSTEKTGKDTSCVTDYYDTGAKYSSYCRVHQSSYYFGYDYGRYDYSNMDGAYTSWNEDGTVSMKGSYQKGLRIGKWEYLDKDGLTFEGFYQDGALIKSVDYERKVPQHRMLREYFPDGSIKNETRLEGLAGDKQKVI